MKLKFADFFLPALEQAGYETLGGKIYPKRDRDRGPRRSSGAKAAMGTFPCGSCGEQLEISFVAKGVFTLQCACGVKEKRSL